MDASEPTMPTMPTCLANSRAVLSFWYGEVCRQGKNIRDKGETTSACQHFLIHSCSILKSLGTSWPCRLHVHLVWLRLKGWEYGKEMEKAWAQRIVNSKSNPDWPMRNAALCRGNRKFPALNAQSKLAIRHAVEISFYASVSCKQVAYPSWTGERTLEAICRSRAFWDHGGSRCRCWSPNDQASEFWKTDYKQPCDRYATTQLQVAAALRQLKTGNFAGQANWPLSRNEKHPSHNRTWVYDHDCLNTWYDR